MKKVISVILCVAMLVSVCTVFGMAVQNEKSYTVLDSVDELASADLGNGTYPIVFVTGIGQSYSYLYDDEGNEIAKWNLFCNDFSFLFKEIGTYVDILSLVGGLLGTLVTGVNLISERTVDSLITSLFRYNTVDKEGKLPSNVVTPLQKCSVAAMDEEAKDNFYRTIPCEDVLGEITEEDLYCFNYSAFSFTYNNASNLNDFINNVVLAQTGAEKVVLIPMSMGASVVSAYLQDYGTTGKVARIVSIVGAWYGSDVLADLVELKYDENAPEMVYNGLVAELIGEPWGYLVNCVIRIFPKATLRSVIDEILNSLVENLVLKTPSLLGLIPPDRYPAIRENRLAKSPDLAYIMEQTDKYYQAQVNLEKTMNTLNKDYGVDFFFIAGYGLGFGGYSSDYSFFQFLDSANEVNSDEIIQIESTVPGATSVLYGTTFSEDYLAGVDAKYISPDKSVDISKAYFPDRCWLFVEQKHELENNNTALKLALDLATGKVTCVEDAEDTYPRFNESRDIKRLRRNYIPDLERWLETNTLTAEQQAVLDKNNAAVDAMTARTINDRDADDALMDEYEMMLVDFGVYGAPEPEEEDGLTKVLKGMSDTTYKIFGAKGYIDILNPFAK